VRTLFYDRAPDTGAGQTYNYTGGATNGTGTTTTPTDPNLGGAPGCTYKSGETNRTDRDADCLPDYWEKKYFGSTAAQNATGDPKGAIQQYNNTAINTAFGNELYSAAGSPTSYDHENNIYIIQPGHTDGYFFADQGNGRWAFSISTFKTSDYYLGRAFGGFGMFTGVSQFGTWKTSCVAGGGTGCDSTSIVTDPVLAKEFTFVSGTDSSDGTAFYLTLGSPAIKTGTNLTALCSTMYGLCQGPPQTFGAGGSCGNGCVTQANQAFDMGAFPFNAGSGCNVHVQVTVTGGTVIQ